MSGEPRERSGEEGRQVMTRQTVLSREKLDYVSALLTAMDESAKPH